MNFSDVELALRRKAQEIFPGSPEDQARFVALAYQESGFNPRAHNTKGEDSFGIFQFGPHMRLGSGINFESTADQQIGAGADYIKQLHSKHGGDWSRILGEFNLGLPRFSRYQRGERDIASKRFDEQYLPKANSLFPRFMSQPEHDQPGQNPFTTNAFAATTPPAPEPTYTPPSRGPLTNSPEHQAALDRGEANKAKTQFLLALLGGL